MMTRMIETRFWIGNKVTVEADTESRLRMVIAVTFRPDAILYGLSNADGNTQWFYDMELSAQEVSA